MSNLLESLIIETKTLQERVYNTENEIRRLIEDRNAIQKRLDMDRRRLWDLCEHRWEYNSSHSSHSSGCDARTRYICAVCQLEK
jgi:hypothetical protein